MQISLVRLTIAVGILVAGIVLALALMPAQHGGHDHDHSKIAAITGVQQADGGPSCTHTRNSHRHTGKTHTTDFANSYRSGGNHRHRGTLTVKYDSGGIYSSQFDRICPMH